MPICKTINCALLTCTIDLVKNILKGLAPELNNLSPPQGYLTYDYPNTNSESQLLNYMRYAEFYGMMQKLLKKLTKQV